MTSKPPNRSRLWVAAGVGVAAIAGAGTYLYMADGGEPEASVAAEPKAAPAPAAEPASDAGGDLAFSIREGEIDNHFLRRGDVAAHVVVNGGDRPRVLVAFPAGNAGAALWLTPAAETANLEMISKLEPMTRDDRMRGVAATFEADAGELSVTRVVTGTVRVIRLFVERPDGSQMDASALPAELAPSLAAGPPAIWSRTSLDGRHRYELRLEPVDGAELVADGDRIALRGASGRVRFRLAAFTDEPALTPVPRGHLLRPDAAADERARNVLAFLTYDEKMLAGSWRFLTYFGRDTLLSVRLLMPVLGPRAIEAGLGSVIERLSGEGRVAHEEDIAEQAALRNRALDQPPADPRTPHFDYKMIDDDALLAPVLATYLLDTGAGRERAKTFLERRTPGGKSYAEAVRRNLDLIIERARPFAASGKAADLIGIHAEEKVGQWRDSQEGLGGGKVPYDVNAVLMPAALEAAARLLATPLLGDDAAAAKEAAELATAWRRADAFFAVSIPRAEAAKRVAAHAQELGIPAEPALEALPEELAFAALVLDGDRRPIPIMHTDDGLQMLFGSPSESDLTSIAWRLEAPYPAGLRTPAGIVVANPAYLLAPGERAKFSAGHYHGATVWSWQQAMLAAGLRRQIERDDLDEALRQRLLRVEALLWDLIEETSEMRTSELWTWAHGAAGWKVVPFGQAMGGASSHQAESNAAQLWSTVYLSVRGPPSAD
jgi:hypothetical protein